MTDITNKVRKGRSAKGAWVHVEGRLVGASLSISPTGAVMIKKLVRLSSLSVNIDAERNGAWIECPMVPGAEFNVRSFNCSAYLTAKSAVLRDLAQRYGDVTVPEDEAAKAEGTLYADHILLGWKGFDVSYSSDAALAALTDPASRPLREAVAWCAARVGQTELEFVEAATKN